MTNKSVYLNTHVDSIEDALDWFDDINTSDDMEGLYLQRFTVEANYGAATRGTYHVSVGYVSEDPAAPKVGQVLMGDTFL